MWFYHFPQLFWKICSRCCFTEGSVGSQSIYKYIIYTSLSVCIPLLRGQFLSRVFFGGKICEKTSTFQHVASLKLTATTNWKINGWFRWIFVFGCSASNFQGQAVKMLPVLRFAFLKETWNVTSNMYSPFLISRDPRYTQAPHRSFPSFPDFFQLPGYKSPRRESQCRLQDLRDQIGSVERWWRPLHPSIHPWNPGCFMTESAW